MSQKDANKAFFNVLKNIGLIVLPIGVVSGAVEYLFENRLYTVLAVLFTSIAIYIIWFEIRVRNIEGRVK